MYDVIHQGPATEAGAFPRAYCPGLPWGCRSEVNQSVNCWEYCAGNILWDTMVYLGMSQH